MLNCCCCLDDITLTLTTPLALAIPLADSVALAVAAAIAVSLALVIAAGLRRAADTPLPSCIRRPSPESTLEQVRPCRHLRQRPSSPLSTMTAATNEDDRHCRLTIDRRHSTAR